MNLQYFKIFISTVFLLFLIKNIGISQSLSGTTWDITVPAISQKPYNFIFGATGNKGNVLMPNGKLADFRWTADGKGNWLIQIEQIIEGKRRIETFRGKIYKNSGTGRYASSVDNSKILPLTMVKK